MWPFTERRHRKRYTVHWNATICCLFPEAKEELQAEVVEISLQGARILLPRMQVGPYHLIVDNQEEQLKLNIHLPEGSVRSSVMIRWYNLLDEERLFSIGVEFFDLPEASKKMLKERFKSLKKEAGI
ncbi:MAG: PilZ domain-containing protein [Desulforhabdus sp.]|nr:PilZ domain-containing protein [Desulforhabdus sp.]